MTDYEALRADAYEASLRAIHELAKTPAPATSILEQIAQLTDTSELDRIKSRALDDNT